MTVEESNFSHAAAFNALADGVNLEFGSSGWGQKLKLLPVNVVRSLTIILDVFI